MKDKPKTDSELLQEDKPKTDPSSLPRESAAGSQRYCGVEYRSALAGPFSRGRLGWMVW